MTKTEAIKLIKKLHDDESYVGVYLDKSTAEHILNGLLNAGFEKPLGRCTIVPDTALGGFKHSESKREWDEEPFTLEAGKRYVRRDGKISGNIEPYSSNFKNVLETFCFYDPQNEVLYLENGSAGLAECPENLIKEFKE